MTARDAVSHLLVICPEVTAAAVIGHDGEVITVHPDDAAGEAIAPLVTTLGGVAERVAQELGRGALEHTILTGTSGTVVLSDLGRGRVLAAVVDGGARLGLLLDDVSACAATVRDALDREVANG